MTILSNIYNLKANQYLFTSESVSEGHPDKVCDQISDAILDELLNVNNEARAGIETLATTNRVVIAGETRGAEKIDHKKMEEIARTVIKDIGYDQKGFSWRNANIEVLVHKQSQDIAIGVDETNNKKEGAGDQGLMFGYACDETDVFMPAPIFYAHKILKELANLRHNGEVRLGPDSKSQVTLIYENGYPIKVASVLVSTQHQEGLSQKQVREIIRPVVENAFPKNWMCEEDSFLVNPTGKFVIGGPDGDCGLTGRKIIVDTYGGAAPHGGGAFSGKDPTKVDRSAAYMARYLAKNIVASGIAGQCDIQIAYAIGVAEPISFYVNTFKNSKISNRELEKFILENIDLTPKGIRKYLKLNQAIYRKTAAYGHFGRESEQNGCFSWEKLDLVEKLKKLL